MKQDQQPILGFEGSSASDTKLRNEHFTVFSSDCRFDVSAYIRP